MSALTRRQFVRRGSLGLLTFCIAGCEVSLTPGDARRQRVPPRVLTGAEISALEALGETLLPGSVEAGVATYVDHQLGEPPARQLLMIKYLNVPAPFSAFYREGLAALDLAAIAAADAPFVDLDEAAQRELVAQMSTGNPAGWVGPPAAAFYFVVRNDALDVVYGTMAGFEALGIPYMAHIEPPRDLPS